MLSFQDIIFSLQKYWGEQGCLILQPSDLPMGAGTFHPSTFLKAIGPEPWQCAYVQPCRRPTDGRYAENPNRLQHYYQFQVIIKPSPDDPLPLYMGSLTALHLDLPCHDLRFVEDNWESPTLGASGLGWEVWLDGMEISQITYFQEVSSMPCRPILLEITYGLERLAMFIQNVTDVFQLCYHRTNHSSVLYGDIFRQSEREQCAYNFEHANTKHLTQLFEDSAQESQNLAEKILPYPSYELVILCSHIFNLLDARHYFSSTERTRYIQKVRELARLSAKAYYQSRLNLGFPLLPTDDTTWPALLTPQQIQQVQEKRAAIQS